MTDETLKSSQFRDAPEIPAHYSPGKLLHDAHLRLSSGFVRTLQQAGHQLTIDTWAVLNVLWDKDGIPQLEIGERIGRDRHQTSRLIDCLSQQGFVRRKSVDRDRRVKVVVLTPFGRSSRTELKRIAREFLKSTFAGVTQEEYDSFIRCLRHVVDGQAFTESSTAPNY